MRGNEKERIGIGKNKVGIMPESKSKKERIITEGRSLNPTLEEILLSDTCNSKECGYKQLALHQAWKKHPTSGWHHFCGQ